MKILEWLLIGGIAIIIFCEILYFGNKIITNQNILEARLVSVLANQNVPKEMLKPLIEPVPIIWGIRKKTGKKYDKKFDPKEGEK